MAAKHVFVVPTLEDIKVRKGATGAAKRFRGKVLHENLVMTPADGRVKGSVKVTAEDVPEYIFERLTSGRTHKMYNFAKNYASLREFFGLGETEVSNLQSNGNASETVPEPPKEVKAAGQRSIEDIMAEAEAENARRDASAPRRFTQSDLHKMTKADPIQAIINGGLTR